MTDDPDICPSAKCETYATISVHWPEQTIMVCPEHAWLVLELADDLGIRVVMEVVADK